MNIINSNSSLLFEKEYICNKDLLLNTSIIYQFLKKSYFLYGKKIAVFLDRDTAVLYIMLAILATDSMYIPIDTMLPLERVKLIIENSHSDMIITSIKYKDFFYGKKVVYIEDIFSMSCSKNIDLFPNQMGDGSAYILFTSGTTGVPKGVLVSKKALRNFIQGTKKGIDFSDCKRIISLTTISFDIFFLESIFAIYYGMQVIMTNYYEQQNPKKILRLLDENKIDTIQLTPSRLRQLLAVDKKLCYFQNIKVIIVGGEAFPPYLLEVLQKYTKARIYNAYGPTEATIWISYSQLNGKSEIDIGQPISDNSFYIINEMEQIVPNGKIGELCISGDNLADCYFNDSKMTTDKFKYLQHSDEKKIRVFKTGDLCCKNKNGDIICLGRIDHQVKINGFRIELEDIESYISKYKDIQNSIVICMDSKDHESKLLVCIYCGEKEILVKDLKEWLSLYLPNYMIPQKYYWISEFNYTIGGKIDRNAIIKSLKHQL